MNPSPIFHSSGLSPLQPRRGHVCAGPECDTLVLFPGRFCMECFADAAKDCARQIETALIASGFAPGSTKLRDALPREASLRSLDWYAGAAGFVFGGELRMSEAVYLRELTEAACLLVAMGGVARLAELPGSPRARSTSSSGRGALRAERPEPKKGRCDFSALPQYTQTEPLPARWCSDALEAERRLQAYWAVTLLVMLALVVLR